MLSHELRKRMETWQASQARELAKRPYAELAALPVRTYIDAPAEFAGHKFCILRSAGEKNGGVRIDVYREVATKSHRGEASGFGYFGAKPFEIIPSGKVIWERFQHDPLD